MTAFAFLGPLAETYEGFISEPDRLNDKPYEEICVLHSAL